MLVYGMGCYYTGLNFSNQGYESVSTGWGVIIFGMGC